MTEKEAIAFCKSDPEAAAKIILMVGQLEQRIKELEAKCNMVRCRTFQSLFLFHPLWLFS
jgi:hypothetical protein